MNQLIVMATGTGKTRVASQVPRVIDHWKREKKRGRLLFLVHRDELATQTADTYREHTGLTVGIEKAKSYAGDAEVVVGSVQTLGPDTGRIARLRPEDFDAVIVDESHHSVRGKHYHAILRHMNCFKGESKRDPETLLLCITATPNRADNLGMELICDSIVYEYGLRDATKDGYLSPLHAYRCETTVDISTVQKTAGDYSARALEKVVNIPERNALVAREYLRVREMVRPDIESNIGRKPYAVLVDFVDNTGRHPLLCASQLYGLREKFNPNGGDVLEQTEEVEALEAANPGLDLKGVVDLEEARRKATDYQTTLQRLDLLGSVTPPALRSISKFSWFSEGDDAYRLALMDGAVLSVRPDALGVYEVSRHVRGVRTHLAKANSLPEAVRRAEQEIPRFEQNILSADAKWRTEAPTDKQCKRLIMIDRKVSVEFRRSWTALYEFAKSRYEAKDMGWSRGGVADRMNAIDHARK